MPCAQYVNDQLMGCQTGIKNPGFLACAFDLLTLVFSALVDLQVALGISTLMLNVPVSLGSFHQANAMALLSLVIASLFVLRPSAASRQASSATVHNIQRSMAKGTSRPLVA